MTSKARKAFDSSCDDIDRLLEFHANFGGADRGRRYRLEVLNKSGLVLLTAFWEAYCEDIAAEALEHIVRHAPCPDRLPKELRKAVAKELKADAHDLSPWKLAGDGWRQVLRNRLAGITAERNRRLNTPKSGRIDELFFQALGIAKLSSTWYWRGMSADQAREKLDRYVHLRGAVAHRGAAARSVTKTDLEGYYGHVERLASKTGKRVGKVAVDATGKELW